MIHSLEAGGKGIFISPKEYSEAGVLQILLGGNDGIAAGAGLAFRVEEYAACSLHSMIIGHDPPGTVSAHGHHQLIVQMIQPRVSTWNPHAAA